MKITLISLAEDIMALGVRSLASYLKVNGHQVRLIFLRGHTQKSGFVYQYSQTTLDEVIKLCRGSGLIGISVYTNYLDRVTQLTRELKSKLDVPIIWGNLHSTVRPEESLEFADMVCQGEGEGALLELADKLQNGQDIFNIKNIWLKKDGQVIKNGVRPLVQDLDSLPFYDFELDDDFVLEGERFRQIDAEVFKEFSPACFDKNHNLKFSFGILGSRGCPHACSYCGNNARKRMYEGQCYLRFRSPEHIVSEIEKRKKDFSYIEMISFVDDAFTAQPKDRLEEFCHLYKERVGLPFRCFASPATINKEKMDFLVDAGLEHVGIGIQSGSDRMQEFYKRYIKADKSLEAALLVNKYVGRIAPPCYDVIIDNPYETLEDQISTLKLLLKFPKPFHLSLFSLVFYPGTDLNIKAKEDGLLKNETEEVSRKSWGVAEKTGYNFLLYLLSFDGNFKWLIGNFLSMRMFTIINNKKLNFFWAIMWRLASFGFFTKQAVLALYRGDLLQKIRWVLGSKG